MKHPYEASDLRKTNDTYAKPHRCPARPQRRTHPNKQTRDHIRLLALLTGTGVLR